MADQRFDLLLLDECSQLTEPAALAPLARMRCDRLLAVGDPKQLPPTLRAPAAAAAAAAAAAGGRRRAARGGGAEPRAHSVRAPGQLRRAPGDAARAVPLPAAALVLASRLFYGGQLRDGLGDAAAAARAPLLPGLPTLGFCEVRGAERVEERDGGSISNGAEAARAVRLLGALRGCGVEPSQVGVVCLYRAQAALVTRLLLDAGLDGHTVSTVDAFQGAERDIIVVSGCRTSASSLGFVGVPTRFNVTITRARHHLLVLGTANALMGDPLWAELITMSEAIPANFLAGAPTPGAAAAAAAARRAPPAGRRQAIQHSGGVE